MQKKNKAILITGHKGFIASNFIKFCKVKKIKFRIFKKNMFKKSYKNKYSHLFHFAFRKNLYNMTINKYFNDNINFTKDLISFSKKNNMQLVFPSTAAYFPSKTKHKEVDLLYSYNLYTLSKILCEIMIKKTKKLDYKILRIFNVYGYGGKSFLDKLKLKKNTKKKFIFKENDWISRDFVSLKDLFNLFEVIIFKKIKKNIYNVASGKSYKLKNIVKHIGKQHVLHFSNDLQFTPHRPVVKADISKLVKNFKYFPEKNIYKYLSE